MSPQKEAAWKICGWKWLIIVLCETGLLGERWSILKRAVPIPCESYSVYKEMYSIISSQRFRNVICCVTLFVCGKKTIVILSLSARSRWTICLFDFCVCDDANAAVFLLTKFSTKKWQNISDLLKQPKLFQLLLASCIREPKESNTPL